MKQKQGKTFYCRRCGLQEYIPFKQDGITLDQTGKIICPVCLSKKKPHSYKMYEVKEE